MKKTILSTLFILSSIICFCQNCSRVWVSDSLFLKPESALYDTNKDILYISNINGEYLAKDGNGFISKVTTDGKIESLKWIEGLDNPQGMGLYKNNLYVADIKRVVQINTITAKIENVFMADSAKFFNDIAADRNGDIYISDCFGNKVYKISGEKMEVWLDSNFLSKPNGLLCTEDDLLLLNMDDRTAYSINKSTKEYKKIFSGIENQDGIVSDGCNGYFVSGAWQGQIYHIDPIHNKNLIIDLGTEKIITADIEYIPQKKLLIIPTLHKTLIGYKLVE